MNAQNEHDRTEHQANYNACTKITKAKKWTQREMYVFCSCQTQHKRKTRTKRELSQRTENGGQDESVCGEPPGTLPLNWP